MGWIGKLSEALLRDAASEIRKTLIQTVFLVLATYFGIETMNGRITAVLVGSVMGNKDYILAVATLVVLTLFGGYVCWLWGRLFMDLWRYLRGRQAARKASGPRHLRDLADMIEAYTNKTAHYRFERVPFSNPYRDTSPDELEYSIDAAVLIFNREMAGTLELPPLGPDQLNSGGLRHAANMIEAGRGEMLKAEASPI